MVGHINSNCLVWLWADRRTKKGIENETKNNNQHGYDNYGWLSSSSLSNEYLFVVVTFSIVFKYVICNLCGKIGNKIKAVQKGEWKRSVYTIFDFEEPFLFVAIFNKKHILHVNIFLKDFHIFRHPDHKNNYFGFSISLSPSYPSHLIFYPLEKRFEVYISEKFSTTFLCILITLTIRIIFILLKIISAQPLSQVRSLPFS